MNATQTPGHALDPGLVEEACDAVRDRIRAGNGLPAPLAAHLRECEPCSSLAALTTSGAAAVDRAGLHGTDTANLLDALSADIAQRLDAEKGIRAWLRERPTRTRFLLAGLGAVAMPLYWMLASRRPDLAMYPIGRLALDFGLFLLPAALVFPLVLRPLHQRAWPEWVKPMLVLLAIFATVTLVSMPAAHWDHPASRLGTGPDLMPRAIACMLTGSISGLPILLWVWMLSRRGGRIWHVGALAAVLAALVGGLAVFLHCPLTSPVHLTLGHATVMLPFVVLALFGRGGS